MSIFALRLGLVGVVQSSLLGSVLSNMLLVLGCAFVAGGFKTKIIAFNRTAASANTSVLLVAVMAMLARRRAEAVDDDSSSRTSTRVEQPVRL